MYTTAPQRVKTINLAPISFATTQSHYILFREDKEKRGERGGDQYRESKDDSLTLKLGGVVDEKSQIIFDLLQLFQSNPTARGHHTHPATGTKLSGYNVAP